MRSTKTPCTSLIILLALSVAAVAQAQPSPQASTSKAQKLEWPRTFSGQPDFAFTRDEALIEARTRSARENESMPITPSLQQLITDDTALDPLRVLAPKVAEVSSDEDVSETDVSATMLPKGQTLMDRLMSQAVDLPSVSNTTAPDLTEFTARLNSTITQTVADWQPQIGRYDFGGALNTLVLQAIVTSPVRYAVINQQRYSEGETFRISVPMSVPDDVITNALQAQMPVSGSLPSYLMATYQDALKNVLGAYYAKRNQNAELGRQTIIVPVRITAITPRQVMLDLNGQPYALAIRYAY